MVHTKTWSQTLSAGQATWLDTSWASGQSAESGTYSVVQEACDRYGECYQHRSSFVVGPLETQFIYLPVVLRGTSG